MKERREYPFNGGDFFSLSGRVPNPSTHLLIALRLPYWQYACLRWREKVVEIRESECTREGHL